MPDLIYLDHAAATPVDGRVLAAMQPFWSELFYNPSATYLPAKQAAQALSEARETVAHWLGTRSSEIVFTAGATEANNLAIHGVMRQYPGANIVVSSIEHDAVLAPARQYECREVAVLPDGQLDLVALEAAIDDDTALVSIMYANNEIGTIEPLRKVAEIIARKRLARPGKPLLFHADAAQAGNYLDLHVARLGVNLMSLNGGKIYGPKASGVLYVDSKVRLLPQIQGGGQERNLRSGTENVAQSVGLATALDLVQTERQIETKRLQALQQQFWQLVQRDVPAATINGSLKKRLPNNTHLTLAGFDNERILLQLEAQGILAAAGSACSASNEEPSHVLRAIGLSEAAAQSSLRFTMGQTTTSEQIVRTVAALTKLTTSA